MSTVFVTLSDSSYAAKARLTIRELQERGQWNGDIVWIAVDFTPEPMYGVRIWEVSHISTESLVQQLQANPLPPLPDNRHFGKLYQWDKLQVFDSYFTQWERVVFLDAGMRVFDTVEPLLKLDWRGKFLAPDDSQPYDNGKRFRIQICKDANLEASKRLFKDYSESMLDSHYFNNCIFLYDTSLLETVKVEELERCMNRYPLFWCNEVGVMNLIFTIKLGVWSPFPERVGNKYLFGWNESNYREEPNWNAFHFIKYSSTYTPMNTISSTFTTLCRTPSDISEHLPTLAGYASICSHVTECGVRGAVSSYAFANAMLGRPDCTLVQVDTYRSTASDTFRLQCKQENVPVIFHEMSDLDCPLENTELLFIDTWHIYGQMKRELARWHPHVTKYIILHDTEVDKWMGETIRCNLDPERSSRETGIPVPEIMRGIWPAVLEFLEDHPEWTIHEHFKNCNGLTVLKRKSL